MALTGPTVVIPLVPQGLRFLHFAIASVVLGMGIPVGGIIGLLQIDPRLRDVDGLDNGGESSIPVLGEVPRYKTLREIRHDKFVTAQAVIIVSLTLAVVSTVSLMHYYEII